MPYDGKGKGTFTPEKTQSTYNYEVDSWVREKEYPTRRHTPPSRNQLPRVDFMVLKVYPLDDPTDITFDTIWGPFDDWEFLEQFLAYDFGEDGSLYFGDTASSSDTST